MKAQKGKGEKGEWAQQEPFPCPVKLQPVKRLALLTTGLMTDFISDTKKGGVGWFFVFFFNTREVSVVNTCQRKAIPGDTSQ